MIWPSSVVSGCWEKEGTDQQQHWWLLVAA
jgi:hypothetical protein